MPVNNVRKLRSVGKGARDSELTCKVCQEDLALQGFTKPGFHCVGPAPEVWMPRTLPLPHHGAVEYKCPRCQRHLGCSACVRGAPSDLVCRRCDVSLDGAPGFKNPEGVSLTAMFEQFKASPEVFDEKYGCYVASTVPRRSRRKVAFKSGIEQSAGRDE